MGYFSNSRCWICALRVFVRMVVVSGCRNNSAELLLLLLLLLLQAGAIVLHSSYGGTNVSVCVSMPS